MTSFLDLSAELRIMVYDHCIWPIDQPRTEYGGLYLSCRQVKDELDAEAKKAWTTFLKDANFQHCTVIRPTIKGFLDNKDLEIGLEFDMDHYQALYERTFARSPSILAFTYLPSLDTTRPIFQLRNLGSVTLNTSDDSSGHPRRPSLFANVLEYVHGLKTGLDGTRRIIVKSTWQREFHMLRACLKISNLRIKVNALSTGLEEEPGWHFCISGPDTMDPFQPTSTQTLQITCSKQENNEAGIEQRKHINDKTNYDYCE